METTFRHLILKAAMILASVALAACGTPPAKDFGGKWQPVNHFRRQATQIPLNVAYTFYAAPMDETLKNMLTRWARDSGRKLSYQLPYDVTLYTPVSDIRTTDLDSAARQLTDIYAAQNVHVSATAQSILALPAAAIKHGTVDGGKAPLSRQGTQPQHVVATPHKTSGAN